MVGIDALSQQTSAVKQLSDHHEMPVCAIHAPCLLFTQRVWGTEPWGKLERSAEMAARGRRRGGRRTPAVPLAAGVRRRLRRGHRRARGVDGHRLRGREHVPVAGVLASRHGDVPARLGPRRRSPTPTPRSTSRTPRSRGPTSVAMAERLGRAAAPRAPHRRHRLGQGRAPGARPRRRWGPRRSCAHLAGDRLRRPHRRWRSTPASAPPARSASATCVESLEFAREHFAVAAPAEPRRPTARPAAAGGAASPDTRVGDPRGGPVVVRGARLRRYDDPRGRRVRRRRRGARAPLLRHQGRAVPRRPRAARRPAAGASGRRRGRAGRRGRAVPARVPRRSGTTPTSGRRCSAVARDHGPGGQRLLAEGVLPGRHRDRSASPSASTAPEPDAAGRLPGDRA